MPKTKAERRAKIKRGIRGKISGTSARPRLSVFRSNRDIYAQLIDDEKGITIVGCSSRVKDINLQAATKTEKSKLVGKRIAEIATAKGVSRVIFDRSGYKYHGRVKALAEGAREGGLIF